MNTQLLIDSIVRQVTVLLAQLATSGGIRAPVAHIANQVFVELANELHAQGVSRKVSADMFGMALRAYIRKLRRLSEGQTESGRTLWQAVLDFVRKEEMVTRERVLERFQHDGEVLVSAILHDLSESGLLFCSGSGRASVYRAASEAELGKLTALATDAGLDELLIACMHRGGPVTRAELTTRLGRPIAHLDQVLQRLVASGRVRKLESGHYQALDLVIPLGSTVGWEAAVFDHFQAMVQTICQRLAQGSTSPQLQDVVGGSTYTFDIWPGHPLELEVKGQLRVLRERCHALRQRVDAHNAGGGLPQQHEQVTTYLGQCVIEREMTAGTSPEKDEGEQFDALV